MSRPYKVTTEEVVGEVVVAEDHISTRIDIPEILPREETAGILTDILKERGFNDSPDGGTLIRERGGVKVEIDPDDGEVCISCKESANIPDGGPTGPCGCRIREKAAQGASIRNNLQDGVSKRLGNALPRLGCELEGVVNQVTKKALRRKASQLGEVTRVQENPDGSMEITIKVW